MSVRAVLVASVLFVPTRAVSFTVSLAAQAEPSSRVAQRAVPSIAASEIARHLAALIADSLPPADSGSAQLEVGARYVAEQFSKLSLQPGLRPGNPPDLWFQEYPVPGGRTLDYDTVALSIETVVRKHGVTVVNEEGYEMRKEAHLPMATDAPLVRGSVREGTNGIPLGLALSSKSIVLAGPHTPASAAEAAVRGKVVFYVPPAGLDSVVERQIVDALARESKGVVVVTDEAPARFAARQQSVRRPLPVIDEYMRLVKAAPAWVVYVRSEAVASVLTVAGLDLTELRQTRARVVRIPPPLSAWFWVPDFGPGSRRTAANVVGLLEGRDSLLKHQYVVVSAHLVSTRPGCTTGDNGDSIAHGMSGRGAVAHDALGVAGLLAVARAFVEGGTRPRRSVLFVASSGADCEFAGAEFVAWALAQLRPTAQPVATLTLDLINGHRGDSVVVDGLEEIDFGLPPAWVISVHADRELAIVSGSILSAPCADQCAFVRRNVPSLYFHDSDGHGAGYPSVPPSTELNPAYTARVAQVAFDLAQAIANAERSVRWSAAVREQLRQGGDGD